jgi:hypothetical protein
MQGEHGAAAIALPTNRHNPIPSPMLLPWDDRDQSPGDNNNPERSEDKRHDSGGFDGPFTDSGYASAPRGIGCLDSVEKNGEDDGDAMTIISAATTVIPIVAHHSISEVCNNIYNRIQSHVNDYDKGLFFDVLPSLIKAFAIRLVNLDPSYINRRIMHFVYSHHL